MWALVKFLWKSIIAYQVGATNWPKVTSFMFPIVNAELHTVVYALKLSGNIGNNGW